MTRTLSVTSSGTLVIGANRIARVKVSVLRKGYRMNHQDTKTHREPIGLPINFIVPSIKDGIKRIVL